MKDKYVVLECRDTLALVYWGAPEYGVWTPTEVLPVIVGRGTKKKKVNKRFCCMPGYAFVPWLQFYELRRRAPMKFNLTALEYDAVGRPKTCTLADLHEMEQVLLSETNEREQVASTLPKKEEKEPEPEPRGSNFNVDDRVCVKVGPFKEMTGTIAKGRTPRSIRVKIGVRYVNMPPEYVELC